MDRKEWLSNLKIGNSVCYKRWDRWERTHFYTIVSIKNITQKGNIRLDSGELLNSDGHYHKRGSWGDGYFIDIEPLTEEIIKEIKDRREKKNAINVIRNIFEKTDLKNIETEKLKKIIEIMEE